MYKKITQLISKNGTEKVQNIDEFVVVSVAVRWGRDPPGAAQGYVQAGTRQSDFCPPHFLPPSPPKMEFWGSAGFRGGADPAPAAPSTRSQK